MIDVRLKQKNMSVVQHDFILTFVMFVRLDDSSVKRHTRACVTHVLISPMGKRTTFQSFMFRREAAS